MCLVCGEAASLHSMDGTTPLNARKHDHAFRVLHHLIWHTSAAAV